MKLGKFLFEITQSLSTFILLNTIWKVLGINTNLTRENAIVDGIDYQILVYYNSWRECEGDGDMVAAERLFPKLHTTPLCVHFFSSITF